MNSLCLTFLFYYLIYLYFKLGFRLFTLTPLKRSYVPGHITLTSCTFREVLNWIIKRNVKEDQTFRFLGLLLCYLLCLKKVFIIDYNIFVILGQTTINDHFYKTNKVAILDTLFDYKNYETNNRKFVHVIGKRKVNLILFSTFIIVFLPVLLPDGDLTSFSIATDGVSASIHFIKPKVPQTVFGAVPLNPNIANFDIFMGVDPGRSTCFMGSVGLLNNERDGVDYETLVNCKYYI